MKCFAKPFVLSAILSLALVLPCFGNGQWELYNGRNGIKTYSRTRADSAYRESKSSADIHAGIDRVAAILADVPGFPQWMYNCTESPLLEQPKENIRILYYLQHAPWPVSDRQAVIRAVTRVDPEKQIQVTDMQSLGDYPYRGAKSRVWMDDFSGQWRLEALDEQLTRVTYTVYSEPGGGLSASLANPFITSVTRDSLKGLMTMTKGDNDE
ncbi:MAG: hypothetical protein JEZ12_12610 [Desulfobacterium sp.]|nr:hypothetical protein [Desulfobacterium sp.]